MTALEVEVDPGAVGFDAGRLARIHRHFASYVDDGRLPGWSVLVQRRGRVAHLSTYGLRDIEAALPVQPDTIFRIFSMTKPVTSVAAMMLAEEGALELSDPVSRYIPSFADLRVYVGGPAAAPVTVPAVTPVTIRHLLTHTSGLTYGFHHVEPVDEMYRAAGFEWLAPPELDLAGCCDAWARLPLVAQPGSAWNYGVSTDVLGRVVEVVSGQPVQDFVRDRITGPLGMADTSFEVPENDRDRLAALYIPDGRTGRARRFDALGDQGGAAVPFISGGGGLLSTLGDYSRFTAMLLGGGELDGIRLLGNRTVAYMTRNHLPGGADLAAYGRPVFSETEDQGVGFGLGFSVILDPARYGTISTAGEYAWGGAASTVFWVDPAEELAVIFMTQLLPSSTYRIRTQLKSLVYGALVD